MSTRPSSTSARAALEHLIAGSASSIAELPVVARTLAAIAIADPVLVHFTFDQPCIEDGAMRSLVTYHLADHSQRHAGSDRDEVRGCCLATWVPGRPLSLSDADAEAFTVGQPGPD